VGRREIILLLIDVGSYLIGLLTEIFDHGGAFVAVVVLCVLEGGLLVMFREVERKTTR
jgi:hypothetical protein